MPRRLLSTLAVVFIMSGAAPSVSHAQYFRFGKNKVQYQKHDWSYLQSKHFDVYFYKGGEPLANFAAKAAEAAYDQIERLLQYRLTTRIPILVYQSHSDFAVTNAVSLPIQAQGIGGVTELFKNRIALPFTGDYHEYRRVVHHELVHAVLNDMFYGGSIQNILRNRLQLRLPAWFNEGLAEYAARGWETQSDMYMREAVLEDNLPPISQLRGYFAYRGGQSVWDFIAEKYGRKKIGEILSRLRSSRSVEASFKQATGMSLHDFSEQWHQRLKEIYYPSVVARQAPDKTGRPLLTPEKHGGYYNTNPALSPRGNRIAYITTKGAYFDVYLADAHTGRTIRKLVDGQTSTAFEELPLLTPGITWRPDGQKIAIAVKSGPSDAIAVVDVRTGESVHYRVPDLDQIGAIAWSPDGSRIAFAASRHAQSDIYVLTLRTREAVNYTNDVFSDHEPSWRPDGKALVFHSDRGDRTTLRRYQAGAFDMTSHDYSQYDVYRLRLGTAEAERLTFEKTWDDRSAKYDSTGDHILFISDRNGIDNLYALSLSSGRVRPLTDASIGITQFSLSTNGKKAAFTTLNEGVPSIYILNDPFKQKPTPRGAPLRPNVWAERVHGTSGVGAHGDETAPALREAAKPLRRANPFMRDALDGRPYRQGVDRIKHQAARASPSSPRPDTIASSAKRVDVQDYAFGKGYDEARNDKIAADPGLRRDPFEVDDNRTEDGAYKPRPYKLQFSVDVVRSAANVSTLYGVRGGIQMRLSDMLGNHRLQMTSNFRINLRSSNYYLSYSYLPGRWDWNVFGYHTAAFFQSIEGLRPVILRYRKYGIGVSARYPLDRFQRFDFDLSGMGVNRANITNPGQDPLSRFLFNPTATFTRDITAPGFLSPSDGYRLAVSLSGSPGNLISGEQIRFVTLLGDARTYTSFGGELYTLAARLSAGVSRGPDPQLFYAAGVQNWLFNRQFDDANGLPLDDLTDFAFATPVLPLRGYDINTQNGSNFGLLNLEFRAPLVAALLPGPLPLTPLYNIQATAFVDAGSVWGRPGADARFNVFTTDASGNRVLDDLRVGAGLGLRTVLLGFPLRLDFAWPFNGRRFGDHQTYISIGLDF